MAEGALRALRESRIHCEKKLWAKARVRRIQCSASGEIKSANTLHAAKRVATSHSPRLRIGYCVRHSCIPNSLVRGTLAARHGTPFWHQPDCGRLIRVIQAVCPNSMDDADLASCRMQAAGSKQSGNLACMTIPLQPLCAPPSKAPNTACLCMYAAHLILAMCLAITITHGALPIPTKRRSKCHE